MDIWLHTSSPPQHIGAIREADFIREYPQADIKSYLSDLNQRRGTSAEYAAIFEDSHGDTTLHVFDTEERAKAWLDRNPAFDVIICT